MRQLARAQARREEREQVTAWKDLLPTRMRHTAGGGMPLAEE